MLVLDDTIAAIATATGPAGLAVVRVSGREALRIAGRVFRGGLGLEQAPSHTLHHGWALRPRTRQRLDEVVAGVFRAPRSYTREDVVELSCHGGEHSSRRVLAALVEAGARPARPGEFTLRAFLNGRMDLAQAEAVSDLIHATTERAHEVALSQLAGALSSRLAALRERLADAAAEVEARVDFAEEVGGVEVPAHVALAITEVHAELARWLEGADYARALRDGARVPIVGRPNVGKSSLFNALLGEARAIVTSVPGTTRDRVSEAIDLDGIRVTLSDTAGMRPTSDPVEALGVSRAEEAIAGGAIVLWVVDRSAPLAAEDRALAGKLDGRRVLAVLNKSDLPPRLDRSDVAVLLGESARIVDAAARNGAGVEGVRGTLAEMLGGSAGGTFLDAPLGNPRHAEALSRAHETLGRAAAAARDGAPGEIVALELRESLAAIGEVTGETPGEDLLDRIFSRFCIGK